MELQVTIDWTNVENAVKKHLSIIGKRQKNENGSLYAGITLSSKEEEDIMKQYINAAAETFVGYLTPFVTQYSSGDFLIFILENTRWADNNNGITVPFEGNFMGYAVAYVANALLGMNYPELAKKYADDMQRHLESAINLIFYKTPPKVSSANYEDVKGSCEINDNETKIGY